MSDALTLSVAGNLEWVLCSGAVERFHYLHTFPDPRCMPLVYSVRLAGEWVGCVVFGRPESNRCYKGGLTYGGKADIASGRARFDRWEVLNLARVWLSPDVQAGGRLCEPGLVPGFTDRKGVWRPSVASSVVRSAVAAVRLDYLLMYAPCFLEDPYQIRAVLSYCDTRIHRGVIYRASGFRLAGTNRDGVETWFFDGVPALDPCQDAMVRHAARTHPRSIRKRHARGQIHFQNVFGF